MSFPNKTIEDLKAAFLGESTAKAKYTVYAGRAEERGFKYEAALFRAAALAESFHARNHKNVLRKLGVEDPAAGSYVAEALEPGVGDRDLIAAALRDAMNGEIEERDNMYPRMIENAKEENQPDAVVSEEQALYAEAQHAALYEKALMAIGLPHEIAHFLVCPICGATWDGEAPEICPVCGVKHISFRKIASQF